MARKPKYHEPTDIVSVRLPVSLIEKFDELCRAMRLGRADFFVRMLRRYPVLPAGTRIVVTGTASYDGVYSVEPASSADEIVIQAAYTAVDFIGTGAATALVVKAV